MFFILYSVISITVFASNTSSSIQSLSNFSKGASQMVMPQQSGIAKQSSKQVLPDPSDIERQSFFSDLAMKMKRVLTNDDQVQAKPKTQETAVTTEDPALKMPDPLFSEAIYDKPRVSRSYLYLYNDKTSYSNAYIPPIVSKNYAVRDLFKLVKHDYDFATFRGYFEGLSKESGLNFNIQDQFGNTLLHYSMRNNNFSAFVVLVESDKINVNVCNYNYICPIHLAVFSSNTAYLKKLLEKGVNIRTINDRFEFPIITAILTNNVAALDMLTEYYKPFILDSEIDYIIWIANQNNRSTLGQRFYDKIYSKN